MKKNYILLTCFAMLTLQHLNAQNNVGIGTNTPDPSAKIDVNTSADGANAKKGFLCPQIALNNTTDGTPFSSLSPAGPANGLLVYNTNTSISGSGASGVGFYYNSGTKAAPVWKKLSDGGIAWLLSGNAGTGASNYIGTNDAVDFVVRTNQTAGAVPTTASERIRVTSAGDVIVNQANNSNTFLVEGRNDANLLRTQNNVSVNVAGATVASDAITIGSSSAPVQKLDINGALRVGSGVIQNGTTTVTATADLGLYSLTSGTWIRIASNAAPIKFFTNQGGGNGAGTNATMAVDNTNGSGVMIAAETGGTGNAGAPNSRAALEIASTTKGLLIPRLTTAQRDAMGTGLAQGLTIYNSTVDCIEYWNTSKGGGLWDSYCCPVIPVTISNGNCVNVYSAAGSVATPRCINVVLSGTIGSTAAGCAAVDFSGFPSGTKITVINNAIIRGKGGNGGKGGQESDAVCHGDNCPGGGAQGGTAILGCNGCTITIVNNGEISGGGGGGGGGGYGCNSSSGGGGGGAGIPGGNAGGSIRADAAGGTVCFCSRSATGGGGSAGAATSGGSGGAGATMGSSGCSCNGAAYSGGNGGSLGNNGGNGGGGSCNAGGGASGYTWTQNGGSISVSGPGTINGPNN